MIVFLNGCFVPAEQATVSVFDRGFLYGDGLFETMRVVRGKPFLWREHLRRLEVGAQFLGISPPCSAEELRQHAVELASRNQVLSGLLRITLSRGRGLHGYSPKGAINPTLVMTAIATESGAAATAPARWRLVTSSTRLHSGDPLSQIKSCNKLPQILARAEAERHGVEDSLLLNTEGEVAECSSANLFWIEGQTVCTPALSSPALPGITRHMIMQLCHDARVPCQERTGPVDMLRNADGVFLTLSSQGIVEVTSLDGAVLRQDAMTQQLHREYCRMWERVL